MAKHKRKFMGYETTNPSKDKYIIMTKSMMMSESFLSLSSSAKELYLYLKLWASGKEEVRYASSLAKTFMSKPTFLKSKNELIEKGFIELIETSKQIGFVNKYKFIDKWKEYGK